MHHGIPAVLHRDEPWLHRHSENGATLIFAPMGSLNGDNYYLMCWLIAGCIDSVDFDEMPLNILITYQGLHYFACKPVSVRSVDPRCLISNFVICSPEIVIAPLPTFRIAIF